MTLLFIIGLSFSGFCLVYPSILPVIFLGLVLLAPKLPIIPIQGYLVPIRIEDLFLAFSCVVLVFRSLVYRERWSPNPLLKWMLIFCVSTAFSLAWGLLVLGTVPDSKIGVLYWLRGPEYFAACLLGMLVVRSQRQFRALLVAFVVFTCLVGVYGVLQEFSVVPVFDAMHFDNDIVVIRYFAGFGEERLFSTFAGPYDLAGFYLFALPMIASLLFSVESKLPKVLMSLVLALSFLCFYLTYARAPLVAILLAMFVCLHLHNRRRLGVLLAIVCLIPPMAFAGFQERITEAFTDTSLALGGRTEVVWGQALHSAIRSPLFGTGPASLGDGMGIDGMYLLLIGMWGICGTVAFLLLVGKTVQWLRHTADQTNYKLLRGVAVGALAGTIGLLVNGITLDAFFSSKIAFTYWFFTGLLFAGTRIQHLRTEIAPAVFSTPYRYSTASFPAGAARGRLSPTSHGPD